MTDKQLDGLVKFSRLADYLSVAQIFLRDNFLLEDELDFSHIKPRLLGHWGTTPGISALFAQILRLSKNNPEYDFLYIVGPGHGFPGFQSGLFIEGSLTYFYPDKIPFSKDGIKEISKGFSAPYKYPSHLNPEAPGVILEGGELGYSLSYAFGSIMDNKKLITITLVGDGESETGPLAASWHANKFINPKNDGAVLPVLHLNGYKISGPTIFGRMEEKDLKSYFASLGYKPIFVEADEHESLHKQMMQALDEAIEKIKLNQTLANACSGDECAFLNWPMIIMKTPKGLGGPKTLNGEKIEGNCKSHQVVFDNLHKDKTQLKILKDWLKSYKIEEIIFFDEIGNIKLDKDILEILPPQDRRVGTSSYAKKGAEPLKIPQASSFVEEIGFGEKSKKDSARNIGSYLARIYAENKTNFRLFSPDETYSNHLDDVFAFAQRNWQQEIKSWDKDISKQGRVIEMLSEHTLIGLLMGYTLVGKVGLFASYEAFAHITSSMVEQYLKFIKVARNVHFRKPVFGLNIFLTSLLERQDHNGFSHQNPSFISGLLNENFDLIDIYFPIDKNAAVYAMERMLYSRNKVNVIVAGKKMKRIFTNKKTAQRVIEDGYLVLNQISDDAPDIVFAVTGDYLMQEALFGISLIRERFKDARVRVVYVARPGIFEKISTKKAFDIFTSNKPVLYFYHGYANSIEKLLFGHIDAQRVYVEGYKESGSTTTPFDMLARNKWTRFDMLKFAARHLYKQKKITRDEYVSAEEYADCKLDSIKRFVKENLADPEEVKN